MSPKGKLLITLSLLSFLALGGLFFALRVWMPFMWFVLVPAVGSFVGWMVLDYKILVSFFGMKTTKQGMNMGVLILLAFIFLVLLNYVGARHYSSFDFSNNQVNSISEQSKKILASLDSDLIVKYFYKTGADRAEENKKMFRELVKHYQDISPKVQLEVVEINERPKLAQDYGANKGSGEAFIEYKGSKNRIENYSEQDFTNAIIKVTRTSKKNIYFLEGHNERSLDDEKSETSLFGFKQMLEKNSYIVKKLSLTTQSKVPQDADVLVIAAPAQQLQASEIKALEDYLVGGGRLFVLLDEKDSFGLEPILKILGVELEKNYIYNVFDSPMGKVVNAQAATVAVEYSTTNEITKSFTNKQMTVFRNPHSLKLIGDSETVKSDVIVKTPESSVALAELDSKDYTGVPHSFNLAVNSRGKVKADSKEFSAVVVADADFLSNILLYQNLNRDLALNAISSLTQETDLISVSAKEPLATKMLVSPPEFSQFFKFTVVGFFFPLPFVFMILSIVLWYRRRHA
jgi:ABC-type uncharacterized transport system involved in gliding motility auxiliary subunit